MKSWIGEYGKIVIMAIMLSVLFLFLWDRTETGFLGSVSKARPESFLKEADNVEVLVQQKPRPAPTLTVKMSKLKYQECYNLLKGEEISASAWDADGKELPVCVTKLTAPDGSSLEESLDPESFWANQRGVYEITYQTTENYQGSYVKKVTKICRFTVD